MIQNNLIDYFCIPFLRKFKKTLPYGLKKRGMKKQVVDLGFAFTLPMAAMESKLFAFPDIC